MKILFEDADICVIDKPSGMTVNNAETVSDTTVQDWFKSKLMGEKDESEFWQKGGVVHRLDRDTSGVMVLAKNKQAYEGLKKQFLERETKKAYLALVHGEMKEEEGLISAPVERHPKMRQKFYVGSDPARTAITEWKVVGKLRMRDEGLSLLEVRPHTGRTHQIRVHMKHIGHPIVGDPIYAGRKVYREDTKWCPRLFLHAKSLELTHPVSGQKERFESLMPVDLEMAVERLGR